MRLILIVSGLFFLIIGANCQENSNIPDKHPNIHKIVVREVLQASSYTYVLAEENNETKWIAIPKMDAEVGETYYYQGGTEMGEFTSKDLNRTFSSILFLNGLISPEVVEGGKTSLNMSPQKSKASIVSIDEPIEPAEGGITIAKLYANKDQYAGKTLKIRGKVTKFNAKIMSRNWIHLQDDAGNQGKMDLTATTDEEVEVGEVITLEGIITLDKDFGAGYFYELIMEEGKILD